MTIEKLIKDEFKKQAKGFSNKQLTLNKTEYLDWIISSLSLDPKMNVLDVAAGTGVLSRALSPRVKQVTSIDISEDMIKEGKIQNQKAAINNVYFQIGHVENLPFEDDKFDLVICRFAVHHFMNPNKVIQEMKRVCKSNAAVCIVDMISPEEEELSNRYNDYERVRDPSHTMALKESQFIDLFNKNGLGITVCETVTVPVNVHRWLGLTETKQENCNRIINDLMTEINTKKAITGMFPFIENGEIMFKQTWLKMIGIQ